MAKEQDLAGRTIVIDDDEDSPKAPAAAPKPEDKAERGTKFVELDGDAKKRFDRIYANLKDTERKQGETAQRLAAAEQRERMMADRLTKAIETIEAMQANAASSENNRKLEGLKTRAEDALRTGDAADAAKAFEELADLKAEEKVNQRKPEKKPEPERQAQPALSQADALFSLNWAQAEDMDGQPIRPWAQPDSEDFKVTQDTIREVGSDPKFANKPVRELLREVDRRMKSYLAGDSEEGDEEEEEQPQRRAMAPPQGKLGLPRSGKPGPLSEAEKKMAENMFLGGPLAKTHKEAHELYLRQRTAIGRNSVVIED